MGAENVIAEEGRLRAPPLPLPCMVVGVTGHRSTHASFPADTAALDNVLKDIFGLIDEAVASAVTPGGLACDCTTTLVTLLADGTDHHAAIEALDRGWHLVTPLPFGQPLNAAINANPQTPADARAILAGRPVADPDTAERVDAIMALAGRARLFELADQDPDVTRLYLAAMDRPEDLAALEEFQLSTARRAAMAGTLLVEQSDIVVAVWDGQSIDSVGGTGHTISTALETGCPVVWIDPAVPQDWQVFGSAEALAARLPDMRGADPRAALRHCVNQGVALDPPDAAGRFAGIGSIDEECWRERSTILGHPYRRIEALFGADRWAERLGSLRQVYEYPEEIETGSGQAMLGALAAIPGGDPALPAKIGQEVLRRFAWTDGISSHLADRYRSGMVMNFLLGAAAIIVGTLYLPLVDVSQKWIFAALELVLLLAIIYNTGRGLRRRLHGRWFETRRAAEYLRHSPFLLALGIARAPGQWPSGVKSWWPEWYARHALRAVGLPRLRVDPAYLRGVLELMRNQHVEPQRVYHRAKSARLNHVHHRLDKLSEWSFAAAVFVVALYLGLAGLAFAGSVDAVWLGKAAKWFTVAAVALPTIGGAIAAIRYFADFERFAGISEVTARRLDHVAERIDSLLTAPPERLDFGRVVRVVHDTDDIVFSEIQAWQAVFSGKKTTIPA